jgi:hypothetical protein
VVDSTAIDYYCSDELKEEIWVKIKHSENGKNQGIKHLTVFLCHQFSWGLLT